MFIIVQNVGLVFVIILFFVVISVISSGESVMEYQNFASTKMRSVLFDSFGTAIYVDCKNNEGPWDGTLEHPYRWIWQGIDAANSGDTVFVFFGVYSDLTGERGVLMGALAGIMEAQYEVLRTNGHSPSEAFNETVEELTQSLIRLVDEKGMDWMYSNCSATAQRGANGGRGDGGAVRDNPGYGA